MSADEEARAQVLVERLARAVRNGFAHGCVHYDRAGNVLPDEKAVLDCLARDLSIVVEFPSGKRSLFTAHPSERKP
jgi:hypothetical protein